MIRLYFDWNALVGLKNSQFGDLEQFLLANEFGFRIFYSTAHIGDIYKSFNAEKGITPEIISDLEYINKITASDFFYYDKPKVIYSQRDAIEIFKDRILSEQMITGFIESAIKNREPSSGSTNKTSKNFSEIIRTAKTDPINATLTIFKDVFSSDLYKDMRETFQQGLGINRDQMYNNPSPIANLDKILSKGSLPEKSFNEFNEKMLEIFNNSNDDWYSKIVNSYIMLDMAGFKEDKINSAENNTYKNTLEDAFHSAFASQCDFYVTSDKRNRDKAKHVYDHLNINTIVASPQELTAFLAEYIEGINKRPFMEDIIFKINDWKKAGRDPENENRYTIWFKSYVLDYFNKAYYFTDVYDENGDQTWMIMLTKEKPTNGRVTYLADIDILIVKIAIVVGDDSNNLTLSEVEKESLLRGESWKGRSWKIGKLFVRFRSIN